MRKLISKYRNKKNSLIKLLYFLTNTNHHMNKKNITCIQIVSKNNSY